MSRYATPAFPRTTARRALLDVVSSHSVILALLLSGFLQVFRLILQPQIRRRQSRTFLNAAVTFLTLASLLGSSFNFALSSRGSGGTNARPFAPQTTGTPDTTPSATATPSGAATSTPLFTSTSTATRTVPASTGTPQPTASPTSLSTTTPIGTATYAPTSTPAPSATASASPTATIPLPTPPPVLTPIPDTNYVDQGIEQARVELMAQINSLPILTSTITGTLVSGLMGGRIDSSDGGLTLGLMPGFVPLTDTVNVQMNRISFQPGDLRATRAGESLAYVYELTATHGLGGPPVEQFAKDVVLVWNINPAVLTQAGVSGWPLHVYTYDEQQGIWQRIVSRWDPQTHQLITATPHFSLYAVGDGFDQVNNYLPTINDFEVDLQTGAATIQYPIDVPQGPGGFGPKVSLSYSSGSVDRVDAAQQGPSSVGWGWSLSTSYVAASQHFFAGGGYQPWTASIVVDGINGDLVLGNDGKWHTSNETFAKIEYTPGAGGDRQGDKWTAWSKDGTKYEFDLNAIKWDEAQNQTGWTTYIWMLSQATDVNGNTIKYRYKFEVQSGQLVQVEKDDPYAPEPRDTRTKAVYPYQIKFGGNDITQNNNSKLLVEFNVVDRHINGQRDLSDRDLDTGIYQSWRIDTVTVKRLLANNGGYTTLHSYELGQSYDVKLPLPDPNSGICASEGDPNGKCLHLTLNRITHKGKFENGQQQQLPNTTFDYISGTYCTSQGPTQYDWGKICIASNGYGGRVLYYYDGAAGDLNQGYRRVRARRLQDGLPTNPNLPPNDPHNARYAYDHRGARLNSRYASDDCCGPRPLHAENTEFRGYTWVRVEDPSGQVTDHYYSQDDSLRGKEWRTQTGKEQTFAEDIPGGGTVGQPISDPDWVVSDGVTYALDPANTTNGVWKINPDLASTKSIERVSGVTDGYDVTARIMVNGGSVPDPSERLVGTWKLVADNGDYWGVKIQREWNVSWNSYQYSVFAIWKANGVVGERRTSYLDPVPPAPRRGREVFVYSAAEPWKAWYWLKLHTSPDGRFALQMYRDASSVALGGGQDYIMLKSGDLINYTPGDRIPSLPTGRTWKFRHEASITTAPQYHTLFDNYSETRTVYSQADTVYQDLTHPQRQAQGYVQQPLVGQANNAQAMYIRYVAVTETSNAVFGYLCCQPGQVKRSKIEYGYDNYYGNQLSVKEHGDLGVTGDERSTHNIYANNETRWIIGRVGRTNVYRGITNDVGGSNHMAQTLYYYDNQPNYGYIPDTGRGLLTTSTKTGILNGVGTGEDSSEQFGYDQYGNRTWVRDPNYSPSNDTTATTTYDSYYHVFPESVLYPTGRSELTQWDYTLDMPSRTIDVNNTVTEHRYDTFGRPLKTWISTAGYGTETSPNQRYIFPDINQQVMIPAVNFYIRYEQRLGTDAGPNEYSWQMRWYDGRGRALQDVSPKNGSTTVMEDTGYTGAGQVYTKTLPYEIPNPNVYQYTPPSPSQPKLTNEYDGLGRTLLTWNADGTRVQYDYNWLLSTGVLDESNHWKWETTDVYGRLVEAKEQDLTGYQPNLTLTRYIYNALDQLEQVTRDATGTNQTAYTMEYDGLGRKKVMVDPDMGRWEYEYDPAGNLIKQRDALYLSNPGLYADHYLHLRYDVMNRVWKKYYGQAHYNTDTADVVYYYDNALGDANTKYSWGKLRMAEVTVAGQGPEKANTHKYEYDPRGMLAKEEVRVDYYSNRTYTTSYTYDLGGRLTSTTYPDPDQVHERVDLTYNEQAMGLPANMSTNKDPSWPVAETQYNARGQLTYLRQGRTSPTTDNITTNYTYDDTTTKRGWLTRTRVTSNNGNTVHLDLNIEYYPNGNVHWLRNQGITSPAPFTNPEFTIEYQYDGLDRLRRATSLATGNYSLFPEEFYEFDSLGRMTQRVLDTPNTYTYTYGDPAHKDAPTAYRGTSYSYDANGNQTTRSGNGSTQARYFDPENRLWKVTEGNVTTTMVYDANGQRLIKKVSTPSPTPTSTATPTNTATATNTPVPANCQAITWSKLEQVTDTGNTIQKDPDTGYAWDSGAISDQTINAQIDNGTGYVMATADSTSGYKMFGLGIGNTSASYDDIDFALEMQDGGGVRIYENGMLKADQPTSYVAGDTFKVALEYDKDLGRNVVRWYKVGLGIPLYTESNPTISYPLVLDTSIYTPGAKVFNAYLCPGTINSLGVSYGQLGSTTVEPDEVTTVNVGTTFKVAQVVKTRKSRLER